MKLRVRNKLEYFELDEREPLMIRSAASAKLRPNMNISSASLTENFVLVLKPYSTIQ